MYAVQLNSFGDPTQVLEVVDIDEPAAPETGHVTIDVEYAPIDVSDLLLVGGNYPVATPPPVVIGNEGVGVVSALGADVTNVHIGDRVLVPAQVYSWAQKVTAPAAGLIVVPPHVDPAQASMLTINPPTAMLLLAANGELNPGDWIVQNSANSGVGRTVIAVARSKGVKTLNFVRRPELVDELLALGADAVLVAGPNSLAEALEVLDGAQPRVGLDGVSGDAIQLLGNLVGPGGTVVNYANASATPIKFDTPDLTMKKLSLEGFYMYYPEHLSKLEDLTKAGVDLMAAGELTYPLAGVFPVTDLKAAVDQHLQGGKVILDFTAKN